MSEVGKHTPGFGGWSVERVGRYVFVEGDGEDSSVCKVYGGQFCDARARLIAAAPDLLEALKACLEQAEMCWLNHYGENPEGSMVPQHIAVARSALEKIG